MAEIMAGKEPSKSTWQAQVTAGKTRLEVGAMGWIREGARVRLNLPIPLFLIITNVGSRVYLVLMEETKSIYIYIIIYISAKFLPNIQDRDIQNH